MNQFLADNFLGFLFAAFACVALWASLIFWKFKNFHKHAMTERNVFAGFFVIWAVGLLSSGFFITAAVGFIIYLVKGTP